MFSKLLKHKFFSQARTFLILSLATLGASVIGSLMLWLLLRTVETEMDNNGQIVTAAFSSLLLVFVFFAIIAYSTGVMIMLYYRFYKQHFTDEGYLTFTLPATTHQHLLSSLLNILIWMVICSLVVCLCAGIILTPAFLMAAESGDLSFTFSDLTGAMEELYGPGYWAIQCLSYLGSFAYGLILPIVAITIGALVAKKHKLLAAFGIGYGITLGVSLIVGILQILALVGDAALTQEGQQFSLYLSTLIPALLYIFIALGGYLLSHHLIDKRLNLT